jgi:hypothetical protein
LSTPSSRGGVAERSLLLLSSVAVAAVEPSISRGSFAEGNLEAVAAVTDAVVVAAVEAFGSMKGGILCREQSSETAAVTDMSSYAVKPSIDGGGPFAEGNLAERSLLLPDAVVVAAVEARWMRTLAGQSSRERSLLLLMLSSSRRRNLRSMRGDLRRQSNGTVAAVTDAVVVAAVKPSIDEGGILCREQSSRAVALLY